MYIFDDKLKYIFSNQCCIHHSLQCNVLSCDQIMTYLYFLLELEVSDSGLYTCTASSESGETSWSASLSVEESPGSRLHRAPDPAMFPAAPSVPTIVNVTKNSVTVTWHPPTPHLGASPIIGYTLEYYSSDLQTGWVVAAHRISTNTMVVSILAKWYLVN